jgi:hypothetical protein
MTGSEPITSVDQMLRVYPAFLFGTPMGIIGLGISALLMVVTLIGERIKWVWVAVVLYVTGLGVVLADIGGGNMAVVNNLLPPFDQLRNVNRPLAIFLLFMLSVRALFAEPGVRSNGVGRTLRAYFAFEVFTCLVLFTGGNWSRGFFGLFVFCLIFISFGVGISRWLIGPEQAYSALRAICGSTALLTIGVIFHLLIRPSSMYVAGRLTGTTGNPQFLGAFFAFGLPTCYGLLLKRDEPTSWRVTAGCVLGLSVGFVLMSGSRAAVIVCAVGVLVFFRRRLGQLLVTSLVAVVVLLTGMQLLGVDNSVSAHIFTTGNSRADVWGRLLQEFLAHPIFGAGVEQAGGESSYFSVPAVYGLVGCIPFVAAIWLMLRDSVRVIRKRSQLSQHAVLADVAVATLAEILVSAVFDNHLLATLAPAVFIIYIILSIYALLLDPVVFTVAPDGFSDLHQLVGPDPFSEVFPVEGYVPGHDTGPFVDPVRNGARF